jgi:hypothetical protein
MEVRVGQRYRWAGCELVVTKIEPPYAHYNWNDKITVPSTGKSKIDYIQFLPRVYQFKDYYSQIIPDRV